MIYIVKDAITLDRLRFDNKLKRELRLIKIEIVAAPEEVKLIEKKINRYYFACGCTIGEVSVIFTLLIFGLIWLFDQHSALLVLWKIVGAVFVAALIGKIIGIALSRYLLQKTYSELSKLLE